MLLLLVNSLSYSLVSPTFVLYLFFFIRNVLLNFIKCPLKINIFNPVVFLHIPGMSLTSYFLNESTNGSFKWKIECSLGICRGLVPRPIVYTRIRGCSSTMVSPPIHDSASVDSTNPGWCSTNPLYK